MTRATVDQQSSSSETATHGPSPQSAEAPHERARRETIRCHEELYRTHRLFEPGSWLHSPAAVVMRALERFELHAIRVLDLGCGVGRHAIPIARRIGPHGGHVTCVDLLPAAIDGLLRYAGEHGMLAHVSALVADIEELELPDDAYDLVIACSCLEHVSSTAALDSVLAAIRRATRTGGVHVLMIGTQPTRTDADTGEDLWCGFELPLALEQAQTILQRQYKGWRVLETLTKPWVTNEEFDGRRTVLRSTCLSFLAAMDSPPEAE